MFTVSLANEKIVVEVNSTNEGENVIERLAKRIFFLAYNASSVMGMGVLQARDSVSEDDVWRHIVGDRFQSKAGSPYADYVYGRMMKVGFEYNDKALTMRNGSQPNTSLPIMVPNLCLQRISRCSGNEKFGR